MEEQNAVVSTPAPEAAPVAESAPAPQADAVEEQETVHINDLLANQKPAADSKPATDKPAGSGAPAATEKLTGKTDGKPEPAKTEQQSQKDIDAAFGKRFAAAREDWEKKAAPDRGLARLMREANPGLTDAQIAAKISGERDEALGLTGPLADLLKSKGLLSDGQPVEEPEAFTDEERQDAADRIGADAEAIMKLAPDFDLEGFIAENADKLDAITRGDLSVMGLYFSKNHETLLKKQYDDGFAAGQQAAVDNIRNRNSKVPNPPTASAPATPKIDFSTMTSEEFRRYEAEIKKQQAAGKRVRFD